MSKLLSNINLTHTTSTAHSDVSPKLWLHEASTPPTHVAGNQTKLSNLQNFLTGTTSHQRGSEAPPLNVTANPKDAAPNSSKLSLVGQWLEAHRMPTAELEAYRREHPPRSERERAADQLGFDIAWELLTLVSFPIGGAIRMTQKLNKAVRTADLVTPDLPTLLQGQKISNLSIIRNVTPDTAHAVSQRLKAEFKERSALVNNLTLSADDTAKAHAGLARELRRAQAAVNEQLFLTGRQIDHSSDVIRQLEWPEERLVWTNFAKQPGNYDDSRNMITLEIKERFTSGVSAENIGARITAAEGLVARAEAGLKASDNAGSRAIKDGAGEALVALRIEKAAIEARALQHI